MSRVLLTRAAFVFAWPALAEDKTPEPKGEKVSGTITLNGKPLAGGTVTFISNDGKVKVTGLITENGTYAAMVPAGEYRIAVSTESPKKKVDPKEPPKQPLPPLPAKYGDPNATVLTATVAKGKNVLDLVLTSK